MSGRGKEAGERAVDALVHGYATATMRAAVLLIAVAVLAFTLIDSPRPLRKEPAK